MDAVGVSQHLLLTVLVRLPAARFVLGLCDGNHCESGEAGRDRGNGRIVVSLFKEFSPPRNHCHWVPEKVISIPATAAFTSYAGLATRGNQLLISSKVRHLRLPVHTGAGPIVGRNCAGGRSRACWL